MNVRKFLAVPVTAGLLVTGLAGCGGNGSSSSNSNSSSSAELPKSAMNVLDRDKIKDGGNVTMVISSWPDSWNNWSAPGNDQDWKQAQLPMWPRFFNTDETGKVSMDKTWLADAKNETKNGQTVITLKMNPKAHWNDGKPFTLADWTNTVRANSGKDKAYNVASPDGWDQIKSVTQGSDANTFIITFDKTYPDWQGLLSNGPQRAESVKDAKTYNDGWADVKKASDAGWFSGPFTLQKADKAAGTIVLKRNPNWWGDTPKLDTVTFVVKDPTSWASAYSNGEIDAFDIGVNADYYNRAKAYTQGEIRRANSLNWRHITFNTKDPVLQDKAVRVAIVEALDRSQIAKSDLAGMGLPEETPLNSHMFMKDQSQYRDVAKETGIDFDTAKADKTLTDAGYKKDAQGYYAKGGKEIQLKFTSLAGIKVSENEGQQVQSQLNKFGLKTAVTPVPQDQMEKVLSKHQFQMIAFSWMGTPYPYPFAKQLFGSTSSSNYSGMNNPQVDKLVNEISVETDQKKRDDLVDQVEQIAWKDPQDLPLYQRPSQWAAKKGLANLGAYGLVTMWQTWENVGWAK